MRSARPMAPLQLLANNLLYDVSQVPIPTDEVDPEQVARPQPWSLGRLTRFILLFGPCSSVFDYVTFFILLSGFAGAAILLAFFGGLALLVWASSRGEADKLKLKAERQQFDHAEQMKALELGLPLPSTEIERLRSATNRSWAAATCRCRKRMGCPTTTSRSRSWRSMPRARRSRAIGTSSI